ncbi:hypothetical protein [Coleofasciculus sp.]|uniref:hypothetical protein n=1 Tax=Coleofasciculus sp. TaxID=3100458 RepID=UPI0039FB030D
MQRLYLSYAQLSMYQVSYGKTFLEFDLPPGMRETLVANPNLLHFCAGLECIALALRTEFSTYCRE